MSKILEIHTKMYIEHARGLHLFNLFVFKFLSVDVRFLYLVTISVLWT